MKQKRLQFFDIVFILTTLLLILASVFSYRYISHLNNSADLVDHTNLVKLELEKTLSDVKDAEAGQRGYLLTHDSSFLAPTQMARTTAFQSISKLAELTKDNPSQQQWIVNLKNLIIKRLDRLDNVLKNSPNLPAPFDSSILTGKLIMDQLQFQVNALLSEEELLLKIREKNKDRFEILTPLYSLLFSVLAIIIVVFVYSRLRNEIRLRSIAETGEATIHNFFTQVPAMLAILKGREQRFVFANKPYIEMIGNRDIVGKTLADALPELKRQGFDKVLDIVFTTGHPYIGKEAKLILERNGGMNEIYVNFVYQAYFDKAGNVEGIMVFCYDVTEMISTRSKLEELEQRSRLAIEASAMGVFDWDLQNQKFISSPRLLEIFGFKNPSTSHKDLLTCFHPVDKATRDAAIERSFIKGSLIYQARIIRHEDKMVCWIHVYGKIIYGENQKPLRMYGSVIDITRERTALEELKENESKFRLLSDSLSQQVWTTDDKGKFNYFNQAVYNFSGAGKDGKEKISWINTIHPDEKADNIKKWTSAIVNGQEFISEHRLRNVEGDYRWHISRAIPQYNELGVRQMWVGTSTDIQDQKNFSEELEKKVKDRTEKLFEKNTELKRSEERYYSMINEVQDYAIILLDKHGNIKHWNKGAEKIKGYSAEEIIGNNFKIFYTAEDLEIKLPDSLLEHAKEHGKSESQGWRVRKDGSRFWGNVVLTALHDDQRMVIGFSKVTRDLTDKKKAEENQLEYLKSIEQKNLELEHNNAELESFNYIASHDLQEPLRKIQAFSQLILEKEIGNLSLSGNDYFNRINDAASRMQNLIEALINYSQTNSSGVEMEETDLNVIISEVKHDLSNIIEEKKAVIESEELFKIVGNHVQLQQLFTNLISNAIKYCKPDKPPHLKITSKMMLGKLIDHTDIINEKKYLKISIEDNGIGFEQKYGTKIFELFQRLHSRTHYKGTGIGLAICKKIMRNHEGFIDAEGQPGIGSTFNLYFPANKSYQGGTISFK